MESQIASIHSYSSEKKNCCNRVFIVRFREMIFSYSMPISQKVRNLNNLVTFWGDFELFNQVLSHENKFQND